MSIDWIVTWKGDQPSPRDVRLVAEDFFGDIGEVVKSEDVSTDHHFIIDVVGRQTHPLGRVEEFAHMARIKAAAETVMDRWVEVYIGEEGVTVTTRGQDEVTNCLASGLARCYTRIWRGDLSEP